MATIENADTNEKVPVDAVAETESDTGSQETLTAAALSAAAVDIPAPVQPLHPVPEHFPEVGDLTEPPAKRSNAELTTPVSPGQPTIPVVPVTSVTPAAEDPHSVHDAYRTYQPERNVCVRCGSSNLARGYVVDYSEKFRQSYFAPKRVSLGRLNSLLSLRPFRSLAKLDAVACRDCGAVLLVVDASELRRAERHRGE
jgi:hypothetical protein